MLNLSSVGTSLLVTIRQLNFEDIILNLGLRQELRFRLEIIAANATKLLSFSRGADWSLEDARQIQVAGYNGYQEVAVKYGILNQTDKQRERNQLLSFITELEHLIGGEQANRTLIHELLRRTNVKDPLISTVADRIEQVTMGTLNWAVFQQSIRQEIGLIQSKIER